MRISDRPVATAQATLSESYRLFAESFRRSLLAENKAPKTIKTYTEGVRLLGEFLAERGMPTDIENIRREHVESFVGDQLERWKPATALNRYRALTVFFGWLIDEGEIKRSPMSNMKPPHVPEEPPEVLTDDQLRRLLKTCEGRDFAARRDTAIIRLLLDTGMRRSECAGLGLEDVDFEHDVGGLVVQAQSPEHERGAVPDQRPVQGQPPAEIVPVEVGRVVQRAGIHGRARLSRITTREWDRRWRATRADPGVLHRSHRPGGSDSRVPAVLALSIASHPLPAREPIVSRCPSGHSYGVCSEYRGGTAAGGGRKFAVTSPLRRARGASYHRLSSPSRGGVAPAGGFSSLAAIGS
jgi:integrase